MNNSNGNNPFVNSTQLVRNDSAPTAAVVAPVDPWSPARAPGGVAPTLKSHNQEEQPHPFRKIHRMLRGRYILTLLLAVIGAGVGTFLGYRSQKPLYRSDGLIKIEPFMNKLEDQMAVMPMYTAYVETQAAIIQGQRVIQKAMESDEWKSLGRGSSADATRDFMKSLDVGYVNGSFFIRVSFSDADSNAAPIAVKSMIQAYLEIYGDVDTKDLREKLQFLEARRQRLMADKRTREDQLFTIAKDVGGQDPGEFYNAMIKEQVALGSQLRQAQFALSAAQAALSNPTTRPGGTSATQPDVASLSITEIANVSSVVRDYLIKKDDAEAKIDALAQSGIGDAHPEMQKARTNLNYITGRLESYAKQFRKDNAGVQLKPDGMSSVTITAAGVAQLKRNVDELRNLYEKQQRETTALGERNVEMQRLQNEIKQAKENLDETTRLIDQNNVTMSMSGRLKVLSYGDKPVTPAIDKRMQASVLGFVGGGALPIALLLLIGLFDQRYRFSDDAHTDLSGIQLLGILPNLPDMLSDPKHAAIAAYCVHQVRTLLQLRINAENNQVFAITSASPGDGKTSLALALGLSFAASGSRTLLIDCDIVGGALTRRMKVASTQGILDAMGAKDIVPFIRDTDVDNVSILPVGAAGLRHASSFSPAAFRKIVAQARGRYEVILIDTGPILGSIEASAVSATADAVILTVARGQQRVMVERALAHLASIGAHFAGVVFNRAENKDFEKSVSRFSMRSVPEPSHNGNGSSNGNGTNGHGQSPYGPIARAVAGSFHDENDNESG